MNYNQGKLGLDGKKTEKQNFEVKNETAMFQEYYYHVMQATVNNT